MHAGVLLHQYELVFILGFFLVHQVAMAQNFTWPKGLPNTGIAMPLDDFPSLNLSKREMKFDDKNRKQQFTFVSNNKRDLSPEEFPRYRFDDSGGKNVKVYIMDIYFNIDGVPGLASVPGGRTVNIKRFPIERHPQIPKGSHQYRNPDFHGHGIEMATTIGGKFRGMAPNCDLELVEIGMLISRGGLSPTGWSGPFVLSDAMDYIVADIQERAARGLPKNVVAMSADYPRHPKKADCGAWENLFNSFLTRLDQNGVMLVTAAGNRGVSQETLAEKFPQYLGKPDNNLMTVGGVYMDGTYWPFTTRESPAGGSISIWAPSDGLSAIDVNGMTQDNYRGETSLAAAMTAGLAAYFLGINPSCESTMNTDNDEETLSTLELYGDLEEALYENGSPVAVKLKEYMIRKSFQRSSKILPPHFPHSGRYVPQKLNAIYNMARGDPEV